VAARLRIFFFIIVMGMRKIMEVSCIMRVVGTVVAIGIWVFASVSPLWGVVDFWAVRNLAVNSPPRVRRLHVLGCAH